MEMAKVKITKPDGTVFEYSDVSFEQAQSLMNLNGHSGVHSTKTISASSLIKASHALSFSKADHRGFMAAITEHAKKFFLILAKNPGGITLDNLAEEMGFDSPMKIGGVTGGGIAKLAPKFGLDSEDLYVREIARKNGERIVTYKPGKDIAKLQ